MKIDKINIANPGSQDKMNPKGQDWYKDNQKTLQ